MRRSGHLGDGTEQLHVGRRVVEVVVGNEAAVGFSAQLAVLLFVHALEERALVPRHAFVAAHGPAKFVLADVHEANLQLLVGLGMGHKVMQATPGRFQPLELLVMEDQIDLFGELLVDLVNDRLNARVGVITERGRVGKGLLRERSHGNLDSLTLIVALWLELPVEQRAEVVRRHQGNLRCHGIRIESLIHDDFLSVVSDGSSINPTEGPSHREAAALSAIASTMGLAANSA